MSNMERDMKLTNEEIRFLLFVLNDRFINNLDQNSIDNITGKHGNEIAQGLREKVLEESEYAVSLYLP